MTLAKGRKILQFAVDGASTPCDGADTRGGSADPALTFPKGGVNEFIPKVVRNVKYVFYNNLYVIRVIAGAKFASDEWTEVADQARPPNCRGEIGAGAWRAA